MDLDTTIAVACFVMVVIFSLILLWLEHKPVRMKYHDQKVGVRTKWWRR